MITHPRGLHDDIIASVAGAVVNATARRGGFTFPDMDKYLGEQPALTASSTGLVFGGVGGRRSPPPAGGWHELHGENF